jgi:dihydrodipicolinate synthase/N-acetylneuraminate lyase
MKFTDYDLFMATKCARYRDTQGNAYQVLFGKDEVMNAALINGITGFVGSTYNYAGMIVIQYQSNLDDILK